MKDTMRAGKLISLQAAAENPSPMIPRRRHILSVALPIAIAAISAASPASADIQSVRRGKAFAKANCAPCHSIGRTTRSPRADAPPFRILHKRYPVETLADALGEGLSLGHPKMPEFRLDPDEVDDFINFVKSLE